MSSKAVRSPVSTRRPHAFRARGIGWGLLGVVVFSSAGCATALEGEQDQQDTQDESVAVVPVALGIPGGEAGLRASLANCRNGDILLANGPMFSGLNAPWAPGPNDWSHAGVFDRAKYDAGESNCILAAGPNGVTYESIAHWSNDQNSVGIFRVKNYTESNATTAVNFAISVLGKPYNITSTLNDNNSYYCSKLVYRAWGAAGVEFNKFHVHLLNLTDGNFTLWYSSPNNIASSDTVSRYYPVDVVSQCAGTSGQWAGCRGNGCAVCSEKLAGYPRYLANHPNCIPNNTCAGSFFTCNSLCPAPTDADR